MVYSQKSTTLLTIKKRYKFIKILVRKIRVYIHINDLLIKIVVAVITSESEAIQSLPSLRAERSNPLSKIDRLPRKN